ncbi:MAG: murein biosynthesis integral membrane protein MurJ [bacterium]
MTETPGPPLAGGPSAQESETATIYGRAGVVMMFTALSRVLGMVRDLAIAHRFGAVGATDAWVQAFRVPNALRRLTAEGSMTIAFIPIYVEVREKEGRVAAQRFAQRVLMAVLLATGVLTVLGVVFSEALTLVTSPGFSGQPEKFALTALLIRWTFPYLMMVSLVAWSMGVLNSEGRYAAPAAAPIFLNLGIVAGVLWMTDWFPQPILAVAAGVLIGGACQMALQVPSLLGTGLRPLPRLDWGDPHLRRLLRLLGPSLLSVAVYELNIIVLGIIASFLPSGQIFHYNNATRLTELVMGLFAFAFATAGLPSLSEHIARQDWRAVAQTARLTFSAAFFTALPAMVGLIVAGPAVVSMLYLHGAYTAADVLATTGTLRVLALGMPAVAAVRVMVPIYYALQDSRTPAILSLLGVAVTAALGWELSRRWDVLGLAAGLTVGTWVYCLALVWGLRGKSAALQGWFPFSPVAKQLLSCAAVAAYAYVAVGFGDWRLGPGSPENWAVLAATVGGAVLVYGGSAWLLGEPEVRNWLALARRVARYRKRDPGGR